MKKTKKVLTVILLVASTLVARSQSCTNACSVPACEYVCNGGFEYYSPNPPSGEDQLSLACGWNNALGGTSPDYFHTSATNSVVTIPCNFDGTENERNSLTGYAGIYTRNHAGWQERIGTQLTNSVVGTSTYVLSFWLSLSEKSTHNEVGSFGFTINQGAFTLPYTNPIHVINTSSVTPYGWTKITYTFSDASMSPAKHLVIGDFDGILTSSLVSITSGTSTCSGYNYTPPAATHVYYYIDDVSLREILPITATASHTTGCSGESFSLTASGVDTYTWTPASPTGSLSCYTCSNPISSYSTVGSPITYTVNGTSNAGCIVQPATITIAPYACCQNPGSGTFTVRDGSLVAYNTGGAIPWTSLTSGNYYTGAIAIPSTGVIQNTFAIAKSMTISTPVTFSLCNISITEDAPIYQNAQTYIRRSWLYGCDKLWEGILSTARLEVYDSYLEDAYNAVKVDNGGTHAGLICDNVVFDKNYYGIVATGTMNPSNFQTTGCVFTCRTISGALHDFTPPRYTTSLAPISGKVPTKIKGSTAHGITANTIRSNYGMYLGLFIPTSNEIAIGEVSATPTTNASYTNYFDYLNCGIYNLWSKVFIKNNSFGNMINTGVGNAVGAIVHDDTPFLVDKVTYSKIGDATAGSNYKNIFNIMKDGVVAISGGTLDVSGNDFTTVNRYGVSVSTWSSSASPLEPVSVASNSYTDCLYPFYAYDNNYIKCSVKSNTVTHVQPTYTAGYCAYINEISKPANGTYSITSNVYSGMLNGIYITNTSGARIVGNTITIKKPGVGVYNAGINLISADYSMVSDNIVSCNPTNSNSWYTYGILGSTAVGSTVQCNTMTKVGSCIKFQGSGSPNYIHNNSLNNTSGADPCLFGVMLDNGANIGHIGHLNGATWEQSDDIWGDFLYGGSNNGADTWTQGSPFTSTGGFIYYDNGKTPALYTPSVNLNSPGNLSFTASANGNTNGNSCGIGARMIVSNTGGGRSVDPTNIISSYSKKRILYNQGTNTREINSNYNSFFTVDSLILQYKDGDSTALAAAQSINAGINPNDNTEQNQKDFNSIYCNFLDDKNSVNGMQIQDIVDMAKLCPFTDGLAVYQARALVRNWDDSTLYYNECEINVPAQEEHARNVAKALEQNPSAIIMEVFPNPANNNVSVKTNLSTVSIEVFDVIGKHVLSQKLIENETKIDVTSLNNGTYLYKITDSSNKVIKNGKLIINH